MTMPPSLRTWKNVLSLCLGAAAVCSVCWEEAACSAGAEDSCAGACGTNGRHPSTTTRAATRKTPATDLELTIDVFIFGFGFWFVQEIVPGRLFLLLFGLSVRLGRSFRVGRFGWELF